MVVELVASEMRFAFWLFVSLFLIPIEPPWQLAITDEALLLMSINY